MLSLFRPRRIILLVLVAASVAAWWYYSRAGKTHEVDEAAALASLGQPGAPRRGLPAPGVYEYRQDGSESGGIGPLSLDRELPSTARMVVRRVGDGVERELNLAKEHIESVRYRLTPGGIRTTWIRTEITFAGFGRDDRRTTRPAPLFLPAKLALGVRWRSDYRTGDIEVSDESEVVGKETFEVDGRPEPVWVVEISSETRGAHPGTQNETIWWSPRYALPLRWQMARDIGGTVKLKVKATLELVSVIPTR